ncbi:N-acetylmuramoyl-L-alanine amidase [Sulfurimonas sp. SAG-AH-194-C20]|nr:glycoside hydrolase family 3 N-terminal domain-containing protein [Sulfurimonas sp. SAG-AH-194-C20]MDF1878171.1 N-acetylmuramoyl-L-alanine amidase [Sulfurimonas sp. SAG-AH-194-C20]
MRIFFLLLQTVLLLNATSVEDIELKKMIGRMLVVGFEDQAVFYNSQVIKDIQTYNLGGVILFDRFYKDKKRVKNILNPYQVKQLTQDLQNYSKKPLFIAIDQEGGKVARLKPQYGFVKIPSAFEVSKLNAAKAKEIYATQAQMLKNVGINLNFAPVVDLSVNPKNRVIVGLERSFGEKSEDVVKYASLVIDAQREKNIISVLKHFPGHGSSLGDSHKGFVDVSETWSQKELEPYKTLIKENRADTIMTAHVFNKHLDAQYPATLSCKINTDLLRNELHFKGLIISDDMQMKAISAHYTLKESTTLAINAGVDILLFGNQLAHNSITEIIDTIYKQVKSGAIPLGQIKAANRRIQNMHTKNSIIQKPIIFTDKRIELTKEYIKTHYSLEVINIKIVPKSVVVHWTAVMSFEQSFERLNPELLFSDRADIAKASALNVSAHFLINRKGVIYQLMPENIMARHVIGLNYSSIGIENVGGESNTKEDLTPAQLRANIRLIEYLKSKYPSIKNVFGHYEYREYEDSKLWLENDKSYRTEKNDPGKVFMSQLREALDK